MAVLIDLTHARRARRMMHILVERHGIRHFLCGGRDAAFRIDPEKLRWAVGLCCEWVALRTGAEPSSELSEWLTADLKRMLIREVAHAMLQAGY